MPATGRLDADEAVTVLYAAHYTRLVRMASLLVRNSGEAEEIVQDAFVAVHRRWRLIREPDRAVGYLRRTIVNAARSAHRRNQVADRHLTREAGSLGSAVDVEDLAARTTNRALMLAALSGLPTRQREVLVLRYYSDLSEADIASTLGISTGAVKSHASRGLRSLRSTLEGPS